MDLRAIPRTAVDRYLTVVRLPVDTGLRLLRNGEGGTRSTVELALDRADAAVRDIAARALRDPELREDAQRRRLAADERERAIRLRVKAEERSREADRELAERQRLAEEKRQDAERRAEARRKAVEERAQAETQKVATAATRRKAAVRKTAAAVEDSVERQERQARLEELNEEAGALQEKEVALTAESEAQRLRRAAGQLKAERKDD